VISLIAAIVTLPFLRTSGRNADPAVIDDQMEPTGVI
jgi:hypothetical protein